MLRKCPFVTGQGVWAAQGEAQVLRSVILSRRVLSVISKRVWNPCEFLSNHLQDGQNKSGLSRVGDFTWSLLLVSATTSQIKEGKKSLLAWHGDNYPFQTLCQQFTFPESCIAIPNSGEKAARSESGIMKARNARYSWIHFLSLKLGTRHWDNFRHLVWTASQSQSLFYIVQLLAPACFCLVLYNGESKFFSH